MCENHKYMCLYFPNLVTSSKIKMETLKMDFTKEQ